MIKLIESANSPHSARYIWNTVIHTDSATIQINEPMPDRITSKNNETFVIRSCAHASDSLTFLYSFLFVVDGLCECLVKEPECVYEPHKRKQTKSSWEWAIKDLLLAHKLYGQVPRKYHWHRYSFRSFGTLVMSMVIIIIIFRVPKADYSKKTHKNTPSLSHKQK